MEQIEPRLGGSLIKKNCPEIWLKNKILINRDNGKEYIVEEMLKTAIQATDPKKMVRLVPVEGGSGINKVASQLMDMLETEGSAWSFKK